MDAAEAFKVPDSGLREQCPLIMQLLTHLMDPLEQAAEPETRMAKATQMERIGTKIIGDAVQLGMMVWARSMPSLLSFLARPMPPLLSPYLSLGRPMPHLSQFLPPG
ncbi:hypothetical protein Q8A73_008265 [Channa argus]|nr:hypothetical protein Q8A73_008265 [Channa argus]